jgi:C4-type Zn-finger protein
MKFQEQIQFFLHSTPHEAPEWMQAHETLKRLMKCMNNEMPFNVILRDSQGGSYISPSQKEKMIFKEFASKTE